MPFVLTCIIVFVSQAIEITFGSLKVIFVTKNHRLLSALFAFVEAVIWAIVVSNVISDITSKPWLLISYCLGNAAGYIIGSFIESKMALGTVSLQITSAVENRDKITEIFDKYNTGYTVISGEGAVNTNCVFAAVMKRRMYHKVMDEINENVPGCFFAISDVSKSVGGH